jgi:hypothetical protein
MAMAVALAIALNYFAKIYQQIKGGKIWIKMSCLALILV